MKQHTPGPWKTRASQDLRPVWDSPDLTKPPKGTSEMPMVIVMAETEPSGICYVWDWQPEGMEANARLIAAAPMLLKALQDLDAVTGSVVNTAQAKAWTRAHKAIKTATGKGDD